MLTCRSVPIDTNYTVQVPEASVSMAQPDTVLPAQKDWTLATSDPPMIAIKLEILKNSCAAARNAFSTALIAFETSTYFFLGKRTPASSAEVEEYVDALKNAQSAGSAIFTPQDEYHSAIGTLSTYVTEVAYILPEKNATKERVTAQLTIKLSKTEQDEQGVRRVLRSPAVLIRDGNLREGIMIYIETVKLRLKSWGVLEANLEKWAKECLGELS
jgi:hypothetical protein